MDTFYKNFQAGANAHSEDDEAPTLNIYASEHEIPIKWQGHILENALAAFHEGRTSLHMATSNGHCEQHMWPQTFKKSECEHCGQIWLHGSLALGCSLTMSWQLQQGHCRDAKDHQC